MGKDRYSKRGVSSNKEEVHAAVDKLDKGVFPNAFCKVNKDFLTNDPNKCCIIHSDGSGTKSILAYIHYKETGDASSFHKTAQDSIVMNLDDLICVGATDNILISSTINRSSRNIDAKALKALILGTEKFIHSLQKQKIRIYAGGGETADVGDLTQTVTVDSCAVSILDKKNIVDNGKIKPGLSIVGLESCGKSNYEDYFNSGIGSNGLTSARHDLLSKKYAKKYPETIDPLTDPKYVYCGPYNMEDKLPQSNLTIGEALLSPTRTYAPIVKKLLENEFKSIYGIIHCSGGGQTKCLRFGENVHYLKDDLLPIPPIFEAIRNVSKTSMKEMFKVYNMGHRLEIYCNPSKAKSIIECSKSFGVNAKIIGKTLASSNKNKLTIRHNGEELKYSI